jgi:5-methyltetrahydropteroyltriglutamate--homocysteine methyltransferase
MIIPTEPIGSIPRPQKLITAFAQYEGGNLSQEEFESICSEAVRDTIEKFEATGSPVISDGEQTKPSLLRIVAFPFQLGRRELLHAARQRAR